MKEQKPALHSEGDPITSRGPHELFEDQAGLSPDAPALVMGLEQISYFELNHRSNQLAHLLRKLVVGPEDIVAVCLDRSFDSVVSLLAILKCGAVYLPLDPKFPKERLSFMLDDSGASLLLTRSRNLGDLRETKARIVLLDHPNESLVKASTTNLDLRSDAGYLAYVIYTSGSTGKPKGVLVPRLALTNFLLSMKERPGITASDTLLAVTTTSFDISILELLLPLVCGARIVIATSEQASDAHELQRLILQHSVTIMQATPTTWRMLIESGWEGKSDLRVLCGGEALNGDLADQLLPRCRELWNMYGPTETTIWSSTDRIISGANISLGRPIANTQFYNLDQDGNPFPEGESGELWIGGLGLARGYLNRPDLTAEKFAFRTIGERPDVRLYRTGDAVCYRPDGSLQFLGRLDQQVKFHGFRIELGEIENALSRIEGIAQAAVILREDRPGNKRLVAYYTGQDSLSPTALVRALKAMLPDYMIPAAFVHLEKFPLTPNVKVDRKALPRPERKRPLLAQDFIAPQTDGEKQLATLWCDLLQLEEIGMDDNFFDLGGNSLASVRMASEYQARFGRAIPVAKVFQYPTIAKLSRFLDDGEVNGEFPAGIESRTREQKQRETSNLNDRNAVAIIGMVGRFPGASNLEQLWSNLCNSVESISFFKPEDLGPGIDESLRNDPDYIRARGLIEDADLFDAAFFGISPLEANVMDPQQRVFLELAQHALENAGYDPERYRGRIGVFAGIGDNHYYTTNLLTRPDLLALAGKLAVEYGNQKDYIALRTAYLLDLRGPAISLNTACSTTLLAVDQAYRSLLEHECDMALSGGIDITVPQKSGFLYQEGGTFAKDGHCRPFDADATGTMFCDGAGVVVLKRLADALNDGDTIYSIIVGTGKNNNGARPASFLAPSQEGQAEAIAIAQSNAGIPVESIGYIEAHGTGTPVGDPIEFEALRKVFERKTNKKQFCYIGSIKGNIGHPTNAAGVAGLIKAALVLHQEVIPPTLHFKKANPKLEFAGSPFMMSDRLINFPRGAKVRRTAVSSFGFGGTNVHAILEEAPERKGARPSRPLQLLPVSARTTDALDAYCKQMAKYLEGATPESFADAAYTFQVGRKQFAHRRFVVVSDASEASNLLIKPNPLRCSSKLCERRDPPVVFLFGGQGTQYVNMGLNLYRDEALFRAIVDDCCEQLKPHLGKDLRELIYPRSGDENAAQASLQDTFFTQPAIFVMEYALARFWQSLGIEPAIMAGHSIGEFVAATLAEVWKLEDALSIVSLRGRLMQSLPRGSMMAVNTSASAIAKVVPPSLEIASNNAPGLCVVSGPEADVVRFQSQLEAEGIVCRHLHTSHAFHSSMMDPIIEPLREAVAKIRLKPPTKAIVSTVTGRPITAAEATDPGYWAKHCRATVQFSNAILYLKDQGYDLFLECGPRSTLCSLARQHFTPNISCTAIPTLADTAENNTEWATLLFALGSLWENGVTIDWGAFYANEERRRIPLPTYPFERQRFWVDPAPAVAITANQVATSWNAADHRMAENESFSKTPVDALASHSLSSRKDRIVSRLIDLLVPVSGHERSQIDQSATFMEQGFDSLSLTQVSFAIRKEFSVKVGFSQLVKEWPNVDMLASYLDGVLPQGVLSEAPSAPSQKALAAAPTVSATEDVRATTPTLEEIVAEQGRTIARLVRLIEKTGTVRATDSALVSGDALANWKGPAGKRLHIATTATGLQEVESTVPQRGIFASSRLSPELSASYNEGVTVHFKGEISIEKMTRAVQRLIARHDALRAGFDETGRIMKINPALDLEIRVTDVSSVQDAAQQEPLLRRLVSDETCSPFSLPAGPLCRCQMVRLGHDRMAVVLTAHHIICDGWSLDVLIHDLCAFYSEELSGKWEELQHAMSFLEYAKNVNKRENSQEFEEAGRYWRSKFKAGFPVLVLPGDHARKVRREFTAHRLDQPVDAAVTRNLRAVAAKSNCSFFAVLLGSLAISLARIARQRKFVIALPTAEQPVIGQPSLAGHCVSLIPFLVELRESESVGMFLKRVQSELLEAQDHSSFTLVSLMQEFHPTASARAISPIAAGLTNVKKFRANELRCQGFSIDYDANPKGFESFEFYLNAVEREEDVELHCHYDVDLFDELTIRKWLRELASVFSEIVSNRSQRVCDLAGLDCAAGSAAPDILYTQTENGGPMTAEASAEPAKLRSTEQVESVISEMDESALLRKLIPLWNRVLSVREIGPDDDFFTLGGQSIAAAQLFDLIEVELGCRVPLATLVNSSTPRKLARAISQVSASDWRCLVPIVRSGSRPPLFLVHGAEGNILLYRSLAAHLGPDQPVYGLQSAGLQGRSSIDARFEHVARHYVDEIRQVQPRGPYMLGGYCLGGTIALEMANQLLEMGESVGLVALIETYNVRAMRWPLPLRQRVINRFILNPYFHLRNILAAEGSGKFAFFNQKLRVEVMRSRAFAEAFWSQVQRIFHPNTTHRIPRAKLADAYNKAYAEYEVKPYPGELTVFLAERRMAGFDVPLGGWEDVAEGGVRLFSLPMSPRGSLIEPYVKELASMLRFCIDAETSIDKDGSGRQPATLTDISQHVDV